MRAIVEMIVDQESFFEMGKDFGPSQICGLAQLNGQPVGILANDCMVYAGAMTAEAAQKYRRFVEMCDTFHVPIVNFVDQPGFMIGPESEAQGTIRYGMAAVCAASQSTIPWAVIQVHKGFGVATAAHYAPGNYVLAWPSVESGALPLEGGVAVAFSSGNRRCREPRSQEKRAGRTYQGGSLSFPAS